MTFRQLRSVPWASQLEWEDVFAWLYAGLDHSECVATRSRGVRRVKAWTSRGKVPHAVDSTASLVEVWLRDGCGGVYGPSNVSQLELRLLYTMTFIRFVNGVVDANQRGMYASSVANLAEQLGLPGWFVDLRHAGTHDQLPTLPLLRSGCTQALQWLHANYWIVQKTYVANTTSDLRSLLGRYKLAMKQNAKGNSKLLSDSPNILSEAAAVTTPDNYSDILIPLLFEPGFLVPATAKKRIDNPDAALPEALVSLWADALAFFERTWPGFIDDMFQQIVATLIELSPTSDGTDRLANSSYLATLAGWAKHCLALYIITRPSDAVEAALETCLRLVNIYTSPLVDMCSKRLASTATHTPTLPSVHDVPPLSPPRQESPPPPPQQTSNITPWTLLPATSYAGHVPIGCLPNGALPNLDLPDRFDFDAEYLRAIGVLAVPDFGAAPLPDYCTEKAANNDGVAEDHNVAVMNEDTDIERTDNGRSIRAAGTRVALL
ncbi:Las1-like-domain-containing protein [Geranomyces variabilis]|nr:Las1-like-domain-containing protein [Geranomyces variabilis]